MNYLTSEKFSFNSGAVADKTFGVVKFSGTDGLSQLYKFDILLLADDPDIDLENMLQEPATLYIHRPNGSRVPFHGILAEIDLVREVGGHYLYRALLVPKLWLLTLTNHNQIFLDKDPRAMISAVLEDGGLTSLDYDFRLQGSYRTWEYVCQYGESHYNFIARWMERNGMYYFFDQLGDSEKVIITDSKMSHPASVHGADITYSPVSGMEAFHLDEAVQSFICRRKAVPKTVLLKDYNYRKPSLAVNGQAQVSDKGHGEVYFYGDHFRTPEEGKKLAKIRSEEFLCRAEQFHGESTVPYLRPGYTAQLGNHFRQALNRSFLTISINHYGNQSSALISGLREELAETEQESVYRNSFTAIGDDVQFRPDWLTERPRIYGTINARIDGAGSGKYAELDDHGRYKVVLPFDLSDRKGGKSSTWIRMMQPYGGPDHGMHFPLHKGTEVLLTFIDGDPDRPVIAGAAANPENPSQVTSSDQTMAKLTTAGGNKIHIEDKEGQERILFQTPGAGTWVRMGMPNDPDDGFTPPDPKPTPPDPDPPTPDPSPSSDGGIDFEKEHHKVTEKEEGYKIYTNSWYSGHYGHGKVEIVGGLKQEIILGNEFKFGFGAKEEFFLGALSYELDVAILGGNFHRFRKEFHEQSINIGGQVTHIHGRGVKIIGNVQTVTGNHTKVEGDVDDVTGDHTSVKGDVTTVTGDVDSVKGNVQTVRGDAQTIEGEVTTVSGNANRITGDVSTVQGQVTTVSGNVETVTGDVQTVSGAVTGISGEVTTVSGDVQEISGEVAQVVGEVEIL